jgi:hypothetical protein
MLILLGAALFAFGMLLFSVGVAIWLLGLALCFAVRLFQLVLLIIMAGIAFASWLQQRRKVTVLEGEILPPERRVLPERKYIDMKLLITALMLSALSLAGMMHGAHATSCWTYRTQWGTQTKCGNGGGGGSTTCWTSRTRWGDVTKCR